MPHICTRCNSVFQSGEDILKGCPVCGWKKFMFSRTGNAWSQGNDPSAQKLITKAMGVRAPPGRRIGENKGLEAAEKGTESSERGIEANLGREKEKTTRPEIESIGRRNLRRPSFQPDLKPDLQPDQKLGLHSDLKPDFQTHSAQSGNVPEASGPESDKLESIKIMGPGTYELNLPSLFEREELIMAIKEGTYFIDLTSAFRKGKKE